jgi:uncharacterized membrane-anchored protein
MMSDTHAIQIQIARLAEGQQRLDAETRRPIPATLDEVTALAARVDAEAQAALWRAGMLADAVARAREVNAWRVLRRDAARLYAVKRVLWGRRHPGAYLRTQEAI